MSCPARHRRSPPGSRRDATRSEALLPDSPRARHRSTTRDAVLGSAVAFARAKRQARPWVDQRRSSYALEGSGRGAFWLRFAAFPTRRLVTARVHLARLSRPLRRVSVLPVLRARAWRGSRNTLPGTERGTRPTLPWCQPAGPIRDRGECPTLARLPAPRPWLWPGSVRLLLRRASHRDRAPAGYPWLPGLRRP